MTRTETAYRRERSFRLSQDLSGWRRGATNWSLKPVEYLKRQEFKVMTNLSEETDNLSREHLDYKAFPRLETVSRRYQGSWSCSPWTRKGHCNQQLSFIDRSPRHENLESTALEPIALRTRSHAAIEANLEARTAREE